MPDGWVRTTIGAVSDLVVDRHDPAALDPATTYVGMEHMPTGSPRVENHATVSGVTSQVTRFSAGDTLFGRLRPYLRKVALADESGTCSPEVLVLRPRNERIAPPFLYLVASSEPLIEHAISASAGSRMPRTSAADLASFEFDLPPLAEQRRIVDLIAAVDAATEAADSYRQTTEMAYGTAANGLLPSNDAPLKALGTAVEVTMGRQRSPVHASGPFMTPYLRAANAKDGRLWLDDVLEMNFDPRERATFALRDGDVLVTEGCGSIAQLGASAPWHGEIAGTVCFQNTLLRLRARPGVTTPDYVEHLARWAHAAGRWAAIASGTNIFHIGSRRAEVMVVPVPSLPEQERIADLLGALDRSVRAAERQAEAVRRVRVAVVEELLSGNHEIPASYDRFLDGVA